MTAYVSDYQHDLFISYGCVDDQIGWVSGFVEDLKRRLSERLGRKDNFSIFRDEERLERHVDLAKQIAIAVERSACLLVVLSPGYLLSDWCKRERNDFLKWVRVRDEFGSRVIVVERDFIDGDKPEEFRNVLGFKFWTGEPLKKNDSPRPLDRNRPSDRDEYNDRVNDIVLTLETEFRRIKSAPRRVAETAYAATVFLAEVTDDLRPQWKKVRGELDQQGLRVVSGGAPRDLAALEKTVAQALQESQLFVQLLSQFPGQPLPGGNETYALLQNRLAVASQKRILQWRSEKLTEEVFDAQDAEDPNLASLHRSLVFGQVRAEHIEDFKRHVIGIATAAPRQEVPQVGEGMVFVSFNPNSGDKELAENLCDYLGQRGFGVVTPVHMDDADPLEIRSDFENNVLNSRSWIVVYGDHRQKYWVRGQLNEINQLLCQHKKQGALIHICAGPPPPKDVNSALRLVGIQLPQMRVIDCQSGFEVERLVQFLEAMTAPPGGASGMAAGPQHAFSVA